MKNNLQTQNDKSLFSIFSLGFPHKPRQNPAEFFVKSLAITPGQEQQSNQITADICKKFNESEYALEMYDYIENECKKSVSKRTKYIPMPHTDLP